uniref:EF-hand domain-containing protein n=1 Tax=Florenciella parvula TaxID=236787 RepID=A0A7S2BPQ8_9STRA|mmetsp:Transcript_18921/g.39539  ORF Transcript_18921/g.39539 Transcript_18921/m.39539 type:complete len:170 (+) Transcript_18921:230-739(+)|eukprot:CAMPEP_0182526708 /NCGR_PEP_ID=MMETSP1323-20130603/3386_1 /TAXON_ID=236787 /ORGANISM="Florenciella parvula, Strain RCC1693" /LENGTH=169 /DNA_ID=CAMNT_0024735611 /DNA_START=230 /DNA_END=739 /DNA_ORIENTATION=-
MIGRVAICLIFAVGAVGGASAFSSPVAPRSWVRMASPSRMVAVSSSSALDDWLAEAPAAPKPADKEQADSQDVFEKLFELADVDASGGIDVDEFKQFYRLLSVVAGEASTTDATALDARLADVFASMDDDGSGTVELTELKGWMADQMAGEWPELESEVSTWWGGTNIE